MATGGKLTIKKLHFLPYEQDQNILPELWFFFLTSLIVHGNLCSGHFFGISMDAFRSMYRSSLIPPFICCRPPKSLFNLVFVSLILDNGPVEVLVILFGGEFSASGEVARRFTGKEVPAPHSFIFEAAFVFRLVLGEWQIEQLLLLKSFSNVHCEHDPLFLRGFLICTRTNPTQ